MMNGDCYPRLLGSVPELSTPRTGLRFLDRYFTKPAALDGGSVPGYAGVHAILVNDPAWQPRPYRPIYFREAKNLAKSVAASHAKYKAWRRAAGAEGALYVAYHLMMGSDAERAALEKGLVKEYRPECNAEFSDPQGG